MFPLLEFLFCFVFNWFEERDPGNSKFYNEIVGILEKKLRIALKQTMRCLTDNDWFTPEASKLTGFLQISQGTQDFSLRSYV